MAITLTEDNVDGHGFINNGYSADWSGCETLKAAVSGKSIYLERVYVNSNATITVTVGADESSSAVATVLLGPIHTTQNKDGKYVFSRPIKLDASADLTVDASGAGAATVIAQGYVK